MLLSGTTDVILAAATSAGKTEAAFLPLLTRLLKSDASSRYILSISAQSAYQRSNTAAHATLRIVGFARAGLAWGCIGSAKAKVPERISRVLHYAKVPGIPFREQGNEIPAFARAAQCVVIDELHLFIGTERGEQVQSLLHRLDLAADRRMARVGLSATLGDKALAAEYLRPGAGNKVQTIDAAVEGYELKLIVKGYNDEWVFSQSHGADSDEAEIAKKSIDEREDNSNRAPPCSRLPTTFIFICAEVTTSSSRTAAQRSNTSQISSGAAAKGKASPMSSGHIMEAFTRTQRGVGGGSQEC